MLKGISLLLFVGVVLATNDMAKIEEMQCTIQGGSFVDDKCYTYDGLAIDTDG